jgi:hypothetical protein
MRLTMKNSPFLRFLRAIWYAALLAIFFYILGSLLTGSFQSDEIIRWCAFAWVVFFITFLFGLPAAEWNDSED